MTFSEVLPYIAPTVSILTMVGGGLLALRTIAKEGRANRELQMVQHQANISRLDGLTDRVRAVEDIGRQQTAILVSFARIETRVDAHEDRLAHIENREAGRRIGAAKA